MPKIPSWVFIFLAALHLSALHVDVMDVDAAQYAEMSREMMESGDYLHLYDRGRDYLDKPPFLFWVSALSMKVFGVSNLSYKLPSVLFALWALYALYRLTRLLYGDATARMAALILGCCQGMFLMTNDIRTDTILMSWTITAIWLIRAWEERGKLYYLLGGCAAIALGMMTKGPIAAIVPVLCFACDWVLKRKWHMFFRPGYLAGLLVIALLLVPMCIGLYQQFDMHPEKLIDGKTGTSGIEFFFWTQSFGRITGENTWDNGAPFSFLFENMLWSFLPWILLFVAALIINSYILVRQRFRLRPEQEWLSTGGFILAYLALGSSSYQLPHYIFIVFPLAAIMVAALIHQMLSGKYPLLYRILRPVQAVMGGLLLVASLLFFAYVFPGVSWPWFVWPVLTLGWLVLLAHKKVKGKILWSGAAAIMIANLFMTNHFYATLLEYQAGSRLGRVIRAKDIPAEKISVSRLEDPLDAVHFYARQVIHRNDSLSVFSPGDYLITGPEHLASLQQKGYSMDTVASGPYYKVSELTPDFLNPKTRASVLRHYYLLRLR